MTRKVLVTKKDDQVTFDIVHMRPLTDRRIFSDPYTMEILEHNHNHFFSESIQQRYVDEVLMQIVKFIET